MPVGAALDGIKMEEIMKELNELKVNVNQKI